ncbi:TPA_asm: hypothetical protein GYO99_02530 [Listeria monocytogenes]|nr:hypothetical protein [Listeria monocytogenes]
MTEYALYKADEVLIIGTVDELAEFQKVKRETIKQLITKAYSEAKADMDIADLMSAYVRELFTAEGEA